MMTPAFMTNLGCGATQCQHAVLLNLQRDCQIVHARSRVLTIGQLTG